MEGAELADRVQASPGQRTGDRDMVASGPRPRVGPSAEPGLDGMPEWADWGWARTLGQPVCQPVQGMIGRGMEGEGIGRGLGTRAARLGDGGNRTGDGVDSGGPCDGGGLGRTGDGGDRIGRGPDRTGMEGTGGGPGWRGRRVDRSDSGGGDRPGIGRRVADRGSGGRFMGGPDRAGRDVGRTFHSDQSNPLACQGLSVIPPGEAPRGLRACNNLRLLEFLDSGDALEVLIPAGIHRDRKLAPLPIVL